MTPPPPIPGSMQQPPRMFGLPPGGQSLPNQSMALNQTGQSKIDPNQIPRLSQSGSVIVHETRQGNQANPPPVMIFLLWFSLVLVYLPKVFPFQTVNLTRV